MTKVAGRLAARFEPTGLPMALGRTVMSLAQLSVLLFTPDAVLFAAVPGDPAGVGCGGLANLSLWCLTGTSPAALTTNRIIAIVVLMAVASGYRPRWTCVPHWYVTFGLSIGLTMPDGGARAAQAATMLIIPLCLADRRTWSWAGPPPEIPPAWRGASYAAHLALRCQIAIIYTSACLSKLLSPSWRNGTAMYAISNDPFYGAPDALHELLAPLFRSYAPLAALTWSVLAGELAIALCMLGPARLRRLGLTIAIMLHAAIIGVMGLFSFGLIMIGIVTLSCAGPVTSGDPLPTKGPPHARGHSPARS
ncbi:sporulation-delaying protein SdpB family protein [Planobispora takensis]|uniref:Sporulation-delaying protein SdpB n=1 Tax=Planobispora takensis TaxID=1367882 RepID=A0A8J3SZ76_9ACTN|nr:sporulation-delaying protein SdpB family protein [Planobispora takensis]GIH98203.1 sporulation-delaying protein SdpB [Planobispora takensis]